MGCKDCGADHLYAPNKGQKNQCELCPAGSFTSSTQSSDSKATRDTCSTCPSGSYCSGNSSTPLCDHGRYSKSGWSQCKDCDEDNLYAPNKGQKNQCELCPAGNFTSGGTSTTRTTCAACAVGHKCDGMSKLVRCDSMNTKDLSIYIHEWNDDGERHYFQNKPGRDQCKEARRCSKTQWETNTPTFTSDRICKDHTRCTDAQWETKAATSTSDRVCKDHTQCEAWEFEITPAGRYHDRECKEPLSVPSASGKCAMRAHTTTVSAKSVSLVHTPHANFTRGASGLAITIRIMRVVSLTTTASSLALTPVTAVKCSAGASATTRRWTEALHTTQSRGFSGSVR